MKFYRPLFFFSALLFTTIFTIENINQRFWLNDFKVYYSAAEALLKNQAVYGLPFGLDTGFYKYSPFVLLLFLPATLFSFQIASCIHFFIIGLCLIISVLALQQIFKSSKFCKIDKHENVILVLCIISVLVHLVREFHLGNVNLIIVSFLSSAILCLTQQKNGLSALFFSLAILFKPYLIILGLPLFLHKKYKVLLLSIIFILMSFIFVVFYAGFSEAIQLHQDWLKAMLNHGEYLQSSNTILSILFQFGLKYFHQSQQFYLIAFLLLAYLFVYIKWIKPQINHRTNDPYLIVGFFGWLALIPNLLITDSEHFLYSLPIILFLINYLFNYRNPFLLSLFIFFVLIFDLNSSDILGHKLSLHYENYGLLGLSNLCLISLLIIMSSRIHKLNLNS